MASGFSAVTLQAGRLRTVILPREGGRIASLRDEHSGVEFLFQPPGPYHVPEMFEPWSGFETSACAGVDDCLPTVTACGAETPGGAVPDHGDFWRLRCATVDAGPDFVTLAAEGYSRPLRLEKTLRLRDDALEIAYTLRNLSAAPVAFLYALHPLLAVDAGDRLLLPPEVASAQLNYSRGARLGDAGETIRWPHPGEDVDLRRVEPVTAGTGDMLYTERLSTGWCGLYRARAGQGIILRFDPRQLPYVGLWLCYGGWPEDGTLARQYAVAFEPTVAPQGSLAAAIAAGQAPVLEAHGSFSFTVRFEPTLHAVGYDEFTAQCAAASAL